MAAPQSRLRQTTRIGLNPTPTPSDERMAKLKAAMALCRAGDLTALVDCDVTPSVLITVGALANASGDPFTYKLAHAILAQMFPRHV